jgi:hypothetical protein
MWIRIRIEVKSWIRIQIHIKVKNWIRIRSTSAGNELICAEICADCLSMRALFERYSVSQIWIQICTYKSKILVRIRINAKSRIRIHINL